MLKAFFTNLTENSSTKKRKDTQDKIYLIVQMSAFNNNAENLKHAIFLVLTTIFAMPMLEMNNV